MGAKRILAMLCVCICTGNALSSMDLNFKDSPSTPSAFLQNISDTTMSTPEMTTSEMSSTAETSTTPTPTTPTPTTPTPTTPTPTTPTPTTPTPTTPTPTATYSPTSSTISPAPNPNPPNPTMNWVVIDEETNVTCIVVKLSALFIVPFHTNSGQDVSATLVLPGNATSNGTCDDLDATSDSHNQKITLQWKAGKSENPNMLTFVFHKNVSSGSEPVGKDLVYLSDIAFQVYLDFENFPNASKGERYLYGELGNRSLHTVAVNNSYRCNSEEIIELSLLEEKNLTIIHITHMQTEAFRTQMDDKFNSAVDCPADKIITSDIVPIAVGCALAALVVVVLVAYLIGRRRARQRGYQSV